MTNAEKFKTVEERTNAFREYCNGRKCTECPNSDHTATRGCGFAWLELEALMPTDEVADILEDFKKWNNGEPSEWYYHTHDRVIRAIDRAVEILRSIKEVNNGND